MKKTLYGLFFLFAVIFILFFSGKIVEGHGGGGGHGGRGYGGRGYGGRGYGGGWGYGGGTYEVNPLILDNSPDFLYEYPWYWYPRRYYPLY